MRNMTPALLALKPSSYEMKVLRQALNILSDWTVLAEDNNEDEGYVYDNAAAAAAGLSEFVAEYDVRAITWGYHD